MAHFIAGRKYTNIPGNTDEIFTYLGMADGKMHFCKDNLYFSAPLREICKTNIIQHSEEKTLVLYVSIFPTHCTISEYGHVARKDGEIARKVVSFEYKPGEFKYGID